MPMPLWEYNDLMKSCVLCSSDKELSADVIKVLINRDVEILYVIVSSIKKDKSYIQDLCKDSGINLVEGHVPEDLHHLRHFDYLFSFNYNYRIPEWIIDKAETALNFHPAPLPDYKGCGVSSWGIINGEKWWGVTCHFLSKDFDDGNIVAIDRFNIDINHIRTGYDLSIFSWGKSFDQFVQILDQLLDGIVLGGEKQGEGHYYSKVDIENAKRIGMDISSEKLDRLIRGLWYPPFEGAFFEIEGKRYYLINQEILNEFGMALSRYEKGGVTLRFADVFDYFTLHRILNEEFGYDFSYEKYVYELLKNDLRILVADIDGNIVGTCEINLVKRFLAGFSNYFLTDVCVTPEYRGKCVGSLIVSAVRLLAKTEKIHAVELTCADYRIRSHGFYLNNGFSQKKTRVFINEI